MRRYAWLISSGFAVACATAQAPGPRVWRADGASAATYSAASTPEPCLADAAPSPALRAVIESSAAARGSVLQGDGRLSALAQSLLTADAAATDPRALELSARQRGIFDPVLDGVIVPVASDPGAALAPLLAAKLERRAFTHYGAALTTRHGQHRLALVLSARRLALAAVPRTLATGQPIRLRGRLPEGALSGRVELLADGAPPVQLSLGAAQDFDVQVPTPRAGVYRVEIASDAPSGSAALAKLLIYVGVPAPDRVVLEPIAPVADLVALRASLIANINRSREVAGLPALSSDARLDAVAEQHSRDMRDHGFIGHQSALSGDPTQRVNQAGLSPGLVLETIARATDPRALVEAALAPTGEARNQLARDATHIGIGLVTLPDSHGTLYVAIELFAQLAPAIDLATATPRLLSLVNEARIQRGTATLPLDDGLSQVARQAAERFLAEPDASEQDVVDATDRELGKFSFAYRRVNALLAVTHRLEDAARLEPALDPQAGGLGLGIAMGQRATQSNVLAIVMIVGVRR